MFCCSFQHFFFFLFCFSLLWMCCKQIGDADCVRHTTLRFKMPEMRRRLQEERLTDYYPYLLPDNKSASGRSSRANPVASFVKQHQRMSSTVTLCQGGYLPIHLSLLMTSFTFKRIEAMKMDST